MGAPEDEHIFGVQLRESANDGSDFSNADADYRKLFLGEDGILHLKDSSGTVTDIGGTIASLDDVGDVNAPSPSNNDVLTWDSTPGEWVAAPAGAGSGALVLLEQHTASNSSELLFTSWYDAAYDEYMIDLINIVPATDQTILNMRCSTDGGSTYDSSALYTTIEHFAYITNGGISGNSADSGTSFFFIDVLDNTTAGGGLCGTARFYNPGSTAHYKHIRAETIAWHGSLDKYVLLTNGGGYKNTAAVDALRFYMSSGNITSGTIRMYGLEK